MIRLLRLTNSSDLHAGVAPHLRASAVVERVISEATGEEVESSLHAIWPSPRLPGLVEEWVEREKPDMVFLRVTSYWCTYESVPLKLRRRLGRFSKPLISAGFKIGENPRLIEYRAYKFLRRLAVRGIGGEPFFTPEEASETIAQVLRRLVAHESLVVVVRGPSMVHNSGGTKAGARRAAQRLARFDRLTAEACARLHVPYVPAVGAKDDPSFQLADDLHDSEAAHQAIGELEGRALLEAWQAARSALAG